MSVKTVQFIFCKHEFYTEPSSKKQRGSDGFDTKEKKMLFSFSGHSCLGSVVIPEPHREASVTTCHFSTERDLTATSASFLHPSTKQSQSLQSSLCCSSPSPTSSLSSPTLTKLFFLLRIAQVRKDLPDHQVQLQKA